MFKTKFVRSACPKWFVLVFIFAVFAVFGNLFLNKKSSSQFLQKFKDGAVYVHFVDVGQGDCALITDKKKTVLIDCGEVDKGIKVARYLKKLGIKKINYFILTHPHTDHFGGFVQMAKKIKVETVVMPKIPGKFVPTNPIYEEFLEFLKKSKSKIECKLAKPGEIYNLGKGKLEILGPVQYDYSNLNDFSVVCRFDAGRSSFLFGGDAQKDAEYDLVKSGKNLKADVFKLNHHGSRTSNTKKFLKAVDAKIFVASVGFNNSYHHPHKKVLKLLKNKKLYRTDLNGSIVFKVDDVGLKVECERRK